MDQTIELDGNWYLNCKFDGCVLIIRAKEPFTIRGGVMLDSRFEFKDAAQLTCDAIKAIASQPMLESAKQRIIDMLQLR